MTPGYFGDPKRPPRRSTPGDWTHTGDRSTVDAGGYFRTLDGRKEIIVAAGGKNVSPGYPEGLVKRHGLVAEACVVGHGRPYPGALVMLDGPAVCPTLKLRRRHVHARYAAGIEGMNA